MELDYMREFIALAKNLNYTSTSEQLFITQPSLTRHIAKIEAELESQLFIRSTHSVQLTEAGKKVQKHFERIVATYDNLLYDLSLVSVGFNGSIRVGMLYYAIDEYISPIVNAYKKDFPSIKVRLYSQQPPEVIPALVNDKIDVGLLMHGEYEGAENVVFHCFSKERPIAMISVNNERFAGRSEVSMEELSQENLVFMDDHVWLNAQVQEEFANQNLLIRHPIITEQIDTVSLAVQENNGAAIVTGHLRAGLQREGIFYADITDTKLTLDACLVTLPSNENPVVSSFIAQAKKQFARKTNRGY